MELNESKCAELQAHLFEKGNVIPRSIFCAQPLQPAKNRHATKYTLNNILKLFTENAILQFITNC
jgi:hypothetical protein